MPNVLIGQTVAEISRFWIFQNGVCRHLGFLKLQIFNARNSPESRTATLCKISPKSLVPRPRYGDFSKMVAVCHLGFVMRVLGPPMRGIWWSLSLCKMWLESMQ